MGNVDVKEGLQSEALTDMCRRLVVVQEDLLKGETQTYEDTF
jgi:hypothetical protein